MGEREKCVHPCAWERKVGERERERERGKLQLQKLSRWLVSAAAAATVVVDDETRGGLFFGKAKKVFLPTKA